MYIEEEQDECQSQSVLESVCMCVNETLMIVTPHLEEMIEEILLVVLHSILSAFWMDRDRSGDASCDCGV